MEHVPRMEGQEIGTKNTVILDVTPRSLVNLLSTLKTEAVDFSEMLIPDYQIT